MQEVETALPIIGVVLTWEPVRSSFASSPSFWEEAQVDTNQGRQIYDVAFKTDYSPQAVVRVLYEKKNGSLDDERQKVSDSDIPRGHRWYNSVAEAKAACAVNCFAFDEVHVVTGTFPPSVEPEVLGPPLNPRT